MTTGAATLVTLNMKSFLRFCVVVSSLLSLACVLRASAAEPKLFRAGAAAVDITPPTFPVIVNAMFTQREATSAHDRLHARALVLDDSSTRIAMVVVDTCMMPRDLIDAAKEMAAHATGIPSDHMLVSATHTHSAPSAMGCLGSNADSNYVKFLPGKIAEAIELAVKQLQPARIGWAVTNDWEHTHCRRWIYRSDKVGTDPFGHATVRANMHPGYQNPDAIAPSGPVDPGLSILSVQSRAGEPIAVLANYSMHYYDSPLLSADYYGLFAEKIGKLAGATNGTFVGIMSQGTSGDQMWMDYGKPRHDIGLEAYADAIAKTAFGAYQRIEYRDWVPLDIRETKLTLGFRVPNVERLDWAMKIVAELNGRLPKSLPEVYAREQMFLHERPQAELKLQAIRIGDLGIAAIPNEVYGISGLKIKARSPFATTFNIELANGAEGYIPPPEQHQLGGYTTWPARTAGLEPQAEPKIVETALALLETVSGKARKPIALEKTAFRSAVLRSQPVAYWPLEEFNGPAADDATGHGSTAIYEDGIAFYLPGVPEPNFSGREMNRAAHFAGGRLKARLKTLGRAYTVEFWFWNGLPNDARAVTAYLFSRGPDGAEGAPGDHLGLGGTHEQLAGKLFFFNGNQANQIVPGRTVIKPKTWNHVAFVRDGKRVVAYLNGNPEPELSGLAEIDGAGEEVFLGGRNDKFANLEGKLDEIALFDRALPVDEIVQHYQASGRPSKPLAAAPAAYHLESRPNSPAESMAVTHVPDAFEMELVAAEPLVQSPVAIDWGADGKLWVVEMADYPMGMDGKMKPGGRVRFLEDSNGDGKFDKSTVFLDNVNFPNGILTWRNGVLVTAAPDIVFAADTNSDGKADVRQVWFTGFNQGNLQLRINGLRWGFDNWVYCANGWSGGNPRSLKTGAEVNLSGRDLRIKPDEGVIDVQAGQSEFGRNRDDWGNWFGCDNSYPLFHFVLNDDYLRRNPYVASPDMKRQLYLPANPKVYPRSRGQKRYHSFDQAGHFTSACSTDFYRDELLFPRSAAEHAFVCEPVHNLIQHLLVEEDGASFKARRAESLGAPEFVSSEDQWFRPVMIRTGPDGALWVVDMYRYMIEHPDWLPPEGKSELAPFYREGANCGRIYRIFPKGKRPPPFERLDQLSSEQLAAKLESSNGWVRDKAQQLLTWRGDRSAVDAIDALLLKTRNPLAKVHALFTLEALHALKDAQVRQALTDSSPGVRRVALQLCEIRGKENPPLRELALRLADDSDVKVRLQLACTLGEWNDARSGEALARLAVAHAKDDYFKTAVMSSAAPHTAALVRAAATADRQAKISLAEPLLNLTLAQHRRDLVAELLAEALSPREGRFHPDQMRLFSLFLDALARRNTSIKEVIQLNDDALSHELNGAAELFAAAHHLAADSSHRPDDRAAAVALFGRQPADSGTELNILAGLLEPHSPAELQRAGVRALGRINDDQAPRVLAQNWNGYSPEIRGAVLDQVLKREPWTVDLLDRIDHGEIARVDIDAQHRERLLKHRSEQVKGMAARILAANSDSDRQKIIEQFRPALSLAGEASRGKEIFTRLCTPCHRLEGNGKELGPNLVSVRGHPREKLLTSIVDPSREVEPRYLAYNSVLANGEELYGLIVSEGGNGVSIKMADGTTKEILRTEIASLRSTKNSLMPEGLEVGLKQQEMADLIEYLKNAAE